MYAAIILILLTLLSAAVCGQSRHTIDLFKNGMRASQIGDHNTALNEFQKTLESASDERTTKAFLAKVKYNLGVSRFHLGLNKEAAEDLETAIRFSEGRYEKASYALGMALAELAEWNAAESAFLQALGLNARNGEAWFDLAFVYLALKNNKKAGAAFNNAVRFGSVDKAIGHNNLGVLLAAEGKYSAAEKHFLAAMNVSSGTLQEAKENLEECRRLSAKGDGLTAGPKFRIIERKTPVAKA